MKTLIAASLLLALTTPANAAWDCDNEISLEGPSIILGHNWPTKGTKSLKLKWDFTDERRFPRIWVNGKECAYRTDYERYKKLCKEGDAASCEWVKDQWPNGK